MTAFPRLVTRPATRAVAVLAAVAAVLLSLLVAPAARAATVSELKVGQTLASGTGLTSPNGTYILTMQGDGNLVLYGAAGARWSTKTTIAKSRLVLQGDGNLVLYTPTNAAPWNSKTVGSAATRLVLQDDGDAVLLDAAGRQKWHTNTATAPTPVSVGAYVPFDVALTPSRFLTSRSGIVTAKFTADGSFAVSIPGRVLWTATAGTVPGKRFLLQGDGNVVLYGDTIALWNSKTSSRTPGYLTVQDDGNLVAYSSTGGAIWSSRSFIPKVPDATSDRLVAGQQLVPGSSIVSAGGAYRLTQQSDGNLVVFSAAGSAKWVTNSSGFNGAYTTLQTDGNLVLYSATGTALWNAKSQGSAWVKMQSDGNLVAYRANGSVAWSSWYNPKPPPLFAPNTSPPPTAVSRYLRNLDGSGNDATFMRTAGCSDAKGVPNGERYLTFLAFGAQKSNVGGVWGVNLTASTGLITNAAVVSAVSAYIDGYRSCMQPYSALTVAVGTNNDGETAGLGANGGKVWADQVVDPIAAYAAAGGRVTVAAANDLEPGFSGSAAQAVSWMQGYLANSTAPFVNTGSADGCPQTLGSTTTCNYGWTPKLLYDVTYGMMPTRALPLVQIYYTSMARQWANISLIGGLATGKRMSFAGPLTEVTACAQAGSCYSMDARTAWNTLWNQLKADSRTTITDLQYTTDLRIDGR